jgi:hypothetical protein
VLLGQRLRECASRDPTARDDDLAEAAALLLLLCQRLLELLRRQQAVPHQQDAEVQPVGGRAQGSARRRRELRGLHPGWYRP